MATTTIGRVGAINGVITWFLGEVPITIGNVGIPGQIIGINDALQVTPIHVRLIPPKQPGSFGRTVETPITGHKLKFGKVSVSNGKISAVYSVSNLPLGLGVQLHISPRRAAGTFIRDTTPQEVVLQLSAPVTNNFNFHFLPAPK
jgi:hypothetical protein